MLTKQVFKCRTDPIGDQPMRFTRKPWENHRQWREKNDRNQLIIGTTLQFMGCLWLTKIWHKKKTRDAKRFSLERGRSWNSCAMLKGNPKADPWMMTGWRIVKFNSSIPLQVLLIARFSWVIASLTSIHSIQKGASFTVTLRWFDYLQIIWM